MEGQKTKLEKIVEALEERDMTAREIAERIGSNKAYTYMLLYRLEALGKIKRKEWTGVWIWTLVKEVKEGEKQND
jgi:DNA-binding IclR family transcriptional regulator